MQLMARGTVIFVHIFSAKYMIEAVLTAEKTVWFVSTAVREVIRKWQQWTFLKFLSNLSKCKGRNEMQLCLSLD